LSKGKKDEQHKSEPLPERFQNGDLQFCGKVFRLCGGASHYKTNQNSTYLLFFTFQFWGAWIFVWVAKPTKAPRGDGTDTDITTYLANITGSFSRAKHE